MIKASAATEIRRLVAALVGTDPTSRDAAAARLVILGDRAVAHLLDTYTHTPDVPRRVSILRVLEGIGDARALEIAGEALRGEPEVAAAAALVLRRLLESPAPDVARRVLDTLMSAAVDSTALRAGRLAALEALRGLPPELRGTVAAALTSSADPLLREAAAAFPAADPAHRAAADMPSVSEASVWTAALEGNLPAEPRGLARSVVAGGAAAPLPALQKLVDAVRERENQADPDGEWRAVRGALHQALALRGSRVALYDLRESLSAAAAPLPVSFLSALHEVGDPTCLEPLALAYVQADADDEWWRQQLAAALSAIIARERLTRRSAIIKRLATRWPAAMAAANVNTPLRTTPRRSRADRT